MRHLLPADDEDRAMKAGCHLRIRREQGGGARRGRRLARRLGTRASPR